MVVYDILGREIAILVNEKQNAGKYQVKWDALNYSSGIYFYKLTTSDPKTSSAHGSELYYTDTKKMILNK